MDARLLPFFPAAGNPVCDKGSPPRASGVRCRAASFRTGMGLRLSRWTRPMFAPAAVPPAFIRRFVMAALTAYFLGPHGRDAQDYQ